MAPLFFERSFLDARVCNRRPEHTQVRRSIFPVRSASASMLKWYVVNPVGHPAIDVEVTLSRDGKVAFKTRTDKTGWFRVEHVSGPYTFQVARTAYAPALREIVVTDEVVTALERKKLYVILGPGACQDACSLVLTSKHDFDREIHKRNRH